MIVYDLLKVDKYKDVEYGIGTDWESIVCPKFDSHQRACTRIGQLNIRLKSKKNIDFFWTFLSECIITDKVAKIFVENGITGFELKEAKVNDSSVSIKLFEFIVTGNGGEAHKDSGIFLKEYCEYCNYKRYSAYENGLIVDERNWDGSDIFTIIGYPKHILITEKVKILIENFQLLGVKLIPSHELKWPDGVLKP